MAQVPPPAAHEGLPPLLPPDEGLPPGLPPPELPPSRRRRRWRWWLALPIALFVYLFLWAVTLVQPVSVFGLTLAVPIPGVSTATVFSLPDRPFTVLVVGLDVRPTQVGQPSRTDSILLLRVDPGRNRAGILSIPRDAMMLIPQGDGTFSQDRVNTAYVSNWSGDDPARAPAALGQTIEHNLGLRADYYIAFDQRGAARIIDAAGGVTVRVKEPFGQEDYSDDDVNVVPVFFPKGEQHLDGYHAVAYGRIREGSSDFDRIRRQQQVAEGLVAQLSSPRSVFRLWGVWGAYRDVVTTDLGMRQTAGLFVYLKRIGAGRIVTRSLGDAAVPCNTCAAALVLLEPEEAARIISEAFDDGAAGRTAADRLVAAGVTP